LWCRNLLGISSRGFFFELGLRDWVSFGKYSKDLFGGPSLISRLSYSGLTGNSVEVFGSVKQVDGLFFKWNFGFGKVFGGTLGDEDFPPIVTPYSNTTSSQREGSLSYAMADLGYNFFSTYTLQLGGFVGYHFLRESLNAVGCTQTASNLGICVPAIPGGLVITQTADWSSVRVGVAVDWIPADRFKVSANAAWVPFTQLNAVDTHVLRPDLPGGTPESGHGSGVQLEAILSYALNDSFSVGVGGRYWQMQANGTADFTRVGGFAQPESSKTNQLGVFLQASYTFGVPGRSHRSQWPSCC
jgi:hypothetical protein